ncbi:MAG: xanthine dehydrogenase family protein molybdopterin-binding subunit [Pseudomonadota bacterium]
MGENVFVSRRRFLKTGAAAAAGLTVAAYLPGCSGEAPPKADAPFAPNAWVRVHTDGSVTVMVDRSEMGQGVITALTMLVAEEIDADMNNLRYEQAPANEIYSNPVFPVPVQVTGGSATVRAAWIPMREAGARARAMLVAAAAQQWGVKPDSCRTENGRVIHNASARSIGYGDLAIIAATLPVPKSVALKDPTKFRLIGKAMSRIDTPEKVTGEAQFGIDVRVRGMLTAVVARCPVFGGKVKSFDDAQAKAVPGVRHIVAIESGVAVVADNYWSATKGREALQVTWDEGAHATLSTEELKTRFRTLAAQGEAKPARNDGDAGKALGGAASVTEAAYELPFLAHATMEPMNCTAHVEKDRCRVWAPTQFQTGFPMFLNGGARSVAKNITGLPVEAIEVHTTLLGGGFGRRLQSDFVAEAVEVSKSVGAPVQVIWSREDDTAHDFYRPMSYHELKGALGPDGLPVALHHRIVAPSIILRDLPSWMPAFATNLLGATRDGVDDSAVEGAFDMPYAIANLRVDWVHAETPVPIGYWRSVGHSYTAFVVESFIDELAAAARQDPFEYRRRMLANAPRHLAVLELAARKAGWGKPLPEGRFHGIALSRSFLTYVAEVAEVSVENGVPKVHRVVCAVDCGRVVNPNIVEQQISGGVVFGLSALLHGEITLQDGRVQQSNFHDYPVVRMNEAPRIEVHIVGSTEDPTGVGEPGVPPLAPAVCNALFRATGKRVRSLPVRL